LAKSAALGFAVALAVGVLWGFWPIWNFYLCLALGFGVAEAMAWASKGKRGVDLQAVGIVAVVFGLILGRVILANRFNLTLDVINQSPPWLDDVLYLRIIPDGLFAALAAAIVWYRFR